MNRYLTLLALIATLLALPPVASSQEAAGGNQAGDVTDSRETSSPKDVNASPENQEVPAAEAAPPQETRPVYPLNPAIQKLVTDQYQWTPEDPSFLYETRFIPDIKAKEEFLSPEVEKEVIRERIEEEKNFRESFDKIKIRLPGLKQTAIFIALVIVIIVYRSRAKRQRGKY